MSYREREMNADNKANRRIASGSGLLGHTVHDNDFFVLLKYPKGRTTKSLKKVPMPTKFKWNALVVGPHVK